MFSIVSGSGRSMSPGSLANDPSALAAWLADKGFPLPDGLDTNLAPYVTDGWEIVAIQAGCVRSSRLFALPATCSR